MVTKTHTLRDKPKFTKSCSKIGNFILLFIVKKKLRAAYDVRMGLKMDTLRFCVHFEDIGHAISVT